MTTVPTPSEQVTVTQHDGHGSWHVECEVHGLIAVTTRKHAERAAQAHRLALHPRFRPAVVADALGRAREGTVIP